MRKKNDALRDTILDCARSLADTEGIASVNIRTIAGKAHIATGTVYNYFSSKDEILLALTEEYWTDTLYKIAENLTAQTFCEQLEEIFTHLREEMNGYGGVLMRSLGNVENAGQERMASVHTVLQQLILQKLEQDSNISKDVWDHTFTKERYASFLMKHITMMMNAETPDFNFFTALIRRTVYQ